MNEVFEAWIGRLDDPWPTVATEAFVFFGGTQVFIPGGIDTMFILRALAAIWTYPQELNGRLRDEGRLLIRGVSRLSTAILERAGLRRSTPVDRYQREVAVPPEADLRRLMAAVHFTSSQLDEICQGVAVPASLLTEAIGTAIERRDFDFSLANTLTEHPALRMVDGSLVVAAPHLLAESLVRALLRLAMADGQSRRLAELFHGASLSSFLASLERIGLRQVRMFSPPSRDDSAFATHVVYQCDHDKLHHFVFASDSLDSAGSWSPNAVAAEAIEARAAIIAALAGANAVVPTVRTTLLLSGIGRDFSVSFERASGVDIFSAGALEAILLGDDEPDPLLLWKFQDARGWLSSRTRIQTFDAIDLWGLWHERGRTFLEPNEPMPSALFIGVDFGEPLRRNAVCRWDIHGIRDPRGAIVEVAKSGEIERSIYTRRYQNDERVEYTVLFATTSVWIRCEAGSAAPMDDAVGMARMAAFWISEFEMALNARLASPLAEGHRPIEVSLDFSSNEDANVVIDGILQPRIDLVANDIAIRFTPAFQSSYDATNRSERLFASRLFVAVLEQLGLPNARAMVDSVIDAVAPTGVKRMRHAFNTAHTPALIGTARLRSPRYIQDHDIAVARRVARADEPATGPHEGAASKTWLNSAVTRLFEELKRRMAELSTEPLLRELLLRNESLVHEDAFNDLTMASQLACAANAPSLERKLRDNSSRHARSSIATRFLIELSQGSSDNTGTGRLSDATFDAVLALAGEIFELGILSDIENHGLASVQLNVLPSGYLAHAPSYSTASDRVRTAHAERLFLTQRARRDVRGAREPEQRSRPDAVSALEEAFRAEFAVSLEQLALFTGESLAVAQPEGLALVDLPESEFIARISSGLSWSIETVTDCISNLALESRPAFLQPPAGFTRNDIWPWRFNRGLSYLRRPLLRTCSNRILYTPAHLHQALGNLWMLCLTERLSARTPALRMAMGDWKAISSRQLVQDVRDTLIGNGWLAVANVQTRRYRNADEDPRDLGDADVLAIDPSRRQVLVVECKDIELDRTPHEIANDLSTLFRDRGSHRSAQTKHLLRVERVRSHVHEILDRVFNLRGASVPPGDWNVLGFMVTTRPLVSALLGSARLPVMSLDALQAGELPLPN
ncbi:MAG: hypothetical protein KF782_07895 [Labilithrix sp.]|nr:hypothetical protein [Labilithrix sp.]